MKSARFTAIAMAALAALSAGQAIAATSPNILLDQFGYLPYTKKVAIVAQPQAGFNAPSRFSPGDGANQYQVRDWNTHAVVFSATLTPWKNGSTHAQSGDKGWWFDFSALNTPGSYYVYDTVNQVGSGRFEISASVYDSVLKQATRAFYFQRLGTPHLVAHAGAKWADTGPAYAGTGQDTQARSILAPLDASTARNLSGGWMDAGDTNKYVPFAEAPILQLMEAYRANPGVFGDNLGIPESGNGLPDLLDEVKWELDFLKRMQDGTGTDGLLLKVGLKRGDNNEASPLSLDARPRYYVPECTSATLSGASMFAAAAGVYRSIPSQQAYGSDLLTRAERAWARAQTTTSNFTQFQHSHAGERDGNGNALPADCDKGDVQIAIADRTVGEQWDSAVAAAVYLFELTGKAEYKAFVETNYTKTSPIGVWWGPYDRPIQFALLRYAKLPNTALAVATAIRASKANQNGNLSITDYNDQTDLYRAHMPDAQYDWGSNQLHARAGALNLDFATYGVNPASVDLYKELATQHLHWLHGANPLGLAMLTNMGAFGAESSANTINHSWFVDGSIWGSVLTSPNGPPPGYLTSGPNKRYADYGGILPGISNQPAQKAFADTNANNLNGDKNTWLLTEPSIYMQASYVELLSRLMPPPDSTPPTTPKQVSASLQGGQTFTLRWSAATDNVAVLGYDVYLDGILQASAVKGQGTTLNGLTCAKPYVVTLRAIDTSGNASAPTTPITVNTAACSNAVVVYDDSLASGWNDWSWASHRLDDTSRAKVGTTSIRADFAPYSGVYLTHSTGVALKATSSLSFWVYSNVSTTLHVRTSDTVDGAVEQMSEVTTNANAWKQIVLPRAQLSTPATLRAVIVQLYANDPATVYLDQIQINP